MRDTEVHLYAIIVLTLCHLDESLNDFIFAVTFKMKPAKENLLCKTSKPWPCGYRHSFHNPGRRLLDIIHEKTRRSFCSLAIEVCAEPLRCKDGSAAMFVFVSVLENTGAFPSCGNPICTPKVMAPPFPLYPSCFTVSKSNTHMHIPICTPTYSDQGAGCANVPDSGNVWALKRI